MHQIKLYTMEKEKTKYKVPAGMIRVSVDITKARHKKIRVMAAQRDETRTKQLFEELINEAIDKA